MGLAGGSSADQHGIALLGDKVPAGKLASAQAASTAGNPSVRTALRMSTICRLPSSAPASLRRTRSIAAGNTQSLNGAPLRRAPGLRASTGT
jgi:hypothetical protein